MKKHIDSQSIKIPEGSELLIKPPPKKVSPYDGFSNNLAKHLVRESWTKDFNIKFPEDVALGIEKNIDRKEISKFLELYKRFSMLGWINNYGMQCVLMSTLVRKILAYHGIKSSIKQVTCYWQNERKNQTQIIGSSNYNGDGSIRLEDSIDAHVVVFSNGYILDFSMLSVHYKFGMVAPKACIGFDQESDNYQDFDLAGECAWVQVQPMHPIIKHWRFTQRPQVQELISEYFKKYQF